MLEPLPKITFLLRTPEAVTSFLARWRQDLVVYVQLPAHIKLPNLRYDIGLCNSYFDVFFSLKKNVKITYSPLAEVRMPFKQNIRLILRFRTVWKLKDKLAKKF